MTIKTSCFFILLTLHFFLPDLTFSETVLLKSGKTVEGKLLEKTDKYVKIDFYGVPVTYYLEEIATIDGQIPVLPEKPKEGLPSEVVEEIPGKAEDFFRQGMSYFNKSRYDEAITCFNKAIKLNPKDAKSYGHRGYAYSVKGNFDQAISDCSKAIELNPNYVAAYTERANAYATKGNFDQAISDCNKAIELYPNFSEAYASRGYTYSVKGSLDLAVADYTKAIELKPDYASVYANRAIVYYSQQEFTKAWADIKKAEELGVPVHPEFLNELRRVSRQEN